MNTAFLIVGVILISLFSLFGIVVLLSGVFLARMAIIVSENLEDYKELEQETKNK
jgi:hypothetical protein